MKRFLFGFLAFFFLILNTLPYLYIMADDMPTSSQYEMLGAYALSSLITSGEATELDFSDYTENDTSFLIDLGEAIFTGDWSGLAEDGLEWLGETADSVYDSYKEYISQWKSDHLGLMYSNWFPDEQIYVGPDDSYNLAKPLSELLTPRNNNNVPVYPDVDFSAICSNLSGYLYYFSGQRYNVDFGSCDYEYNIGFGNYPLYPQYPFSICWGVNGNKSYFTSIGSVYLTINQDTTVSATYIFPHKTAFLNVNGLGKNWTSNVSFQNYNGDIATKLVFRDDLTITNDNINDAAQNDFAGISTAMNYLNQKFRHINLFVNGVQWAAASGPDYPIIIPGQLTIYNDVPLQYSFPADTYIELPDLTNIIRNAINTSGVVMWSDIADTYVDINGQTAVAVTKIIRNDYDNLYQEQYPYPAMLIGMTDNTKFNEHLLDNSQGYLSPMVDVVEETVNVLPSEIIGVLAIGAILTIFAVIINRLLE